MKKYQLLEAPIEDEGVVEVPDDATIIGVTASSEPTDPGNIVTAVKLKAIIVRPVPELKVAEASSEEPDEKGPGKEVKEEPDAT